MRNVGSEGASSTLLPGCDCDFKQVTYFSEAQYVHLYHGDNTNIGGYDEI
jgi:hypothetical protein